MNEFQVIDSVMPDVPPASPDRLAAARERVLGAAAVPATSRARRSGRRVWTGMVLAAAAVALVVGAVAVVVPLAGGPVAATPMRKLEAAAAKLAATPEPKGRYWRQDIERILLMKGGGEYRVEERAAETLAFGPSREVYGWSRQVSAKPYTAADEKEWKRSGSPGLCSVGCGKDARAYSQTDLRDALELADGLKPTLVELRNLPADPGSLKARLLGSYDPRLATGREAWLAEALVRLVTSTPASPGTRAAAYLLLAKAPGVTVLDGVTAPFGLDGVALRLSGGTRIVIDRTTGELVGVQWESPDGTPYSTDIVRKAGWTDVRPVAPPKCAGCTAQL